MSTTAQSATKAQLVDPRGQRFAAAITSAMLALTLILGPMAGLWVLVVQTLVFAAGSLLGLQYSPWGLLYKSLVRPRLGPPDELEDARPPRFAQTVGLAFAVVGLIGAIAGLTVLFYVAIGFALVAALLTAIFSFCLGCEIYLLGKRVLAR